MGNTVYDADHLRRAIAPKAALAVIPNNPSRALIYPLDKHLYARRHPVDRCFSQLKQLRRVPARFEKNRSNYRASLAQPSCAVSRSGSTSLPTRSTTSLITISTTSPATFSRRANLTGVARSESATISRRLAERRIEPRARNRRHIRRPARKCPRLCDPSPHETRCDGPPRLTESSCSRN